jgi:hypothetical protein
MKFDLGVVFLVTVIALIAFAVTSAFQGARGISNEQYRSVLSDPCVKDEARKILRESGKIPKDSYDMLVKKAQVCSEAEQKMKLVENSKK